MSLTVQLFINLEGVLLKKQTPNYQLMTISLKPCHLLPHLWLAPNTAFSSSLGQCMELDRPYAAVTQHWAVAGMAGYKYDNVQSGRPFSAVLS